MDELITSSSGAFGIGQTTNVFTVPDLAARSGNPKKKKKSKRRPRNRKRLALIKARSGALASRVQCWYE